MSRYTGKKCRLVSMFGLTSVFFVVEICVGHFTNSTALLADSFHMLSDIAALSVAFLSVKMSPMKWSQNTFGWARAEVLGALVNGVFLSAMCFTILVEAIKRFIEVEEIKDPKLIVIVGSLGLGVNIFGLILFQKHGHHIHSPIVSEVTVSAMDEHGRGESLNMALQDVRMKPNPQQLNMKGVFLHILADALGSLIVVVSAVVIWLTDWPWKFYIDPALSIVMVVIILHSSWPLLRESSLILLQTVPMHIEVEAIQKRLLENVEGVLGVHELHIWQLAGDRIIASAHILCRNLPEYMKIAGRVKEFFHNEGIHSTTIQPEFIEIEDNPSDFVDCVLDCPDATNCSFSTCCGPSRESPISCRKRSGTQIINS